MVATTREKGDMTVGLIQAKCECKYSTNLLNAPYAPASQRRCMQLSWLYLCGICPEVWPNTAFQAATISHSACPVTAFMFSCSGTQCTTSEGWRLSTYTQGCHTNFFLWPTLFWSKEAMAQIPLRCFKCHQNKQFPKINYSMINFPWKWDNWTMVSNHASYQ